MNVELYGKNSFYINEGEGTYTFAIFCTILEGEWGYIEGKMAVNGPVERKHNLIYRLLLLLDVLFCLH